MFPVKYSTGRRFWKDAGEEKVKKSADRPKPPDGAVFVQFTV